MTIYLQPMEDEDAPPPPDGAWRLLTPCRDPDGNDGPLLDELDALGASHAGEFNALIQSITRLAATGKPWQNLIQDRAKLHDLGKIRINYPSGEVKEEALWQFRHGQMRLLWCYGGGKRVIILSHTMAKKTRTTQQADKDAAQRVMQGYVTARELGQLKIVGDDDERTLEKLFPKSQGSPGLSPNDSKDCRRR